MRTAFKSKSGAIIGSNLYATGSSWRKGSRNRKLLEATGRSQGSRQLLGKPQRVTLPHLPQLLAIARFVICRWNCFANKATNLFFIWVEALWFQSLQRCHQTLRMEAELCKSWLLLISSKNLRFIWMKRTNFHLFKAQSNSPDGKYWRSLCR